MPSSRATIAAGTRPPRVTATIASNGPAPASRRGSGRAARWNGPQEPGKAFSGIAGAAIRGSLGAGISRPFSAYSGDVGTGSPMGICALQRLEPAHDGGAGEARGREVPPERLDVAAFRVLGAEREGVVAPARRDRVERPGHPQKGNRRHGGGGLRAHRLAVWLADARVDGTARLHD